MSQIIKTVQIATADVPNTNGRIYSKAILADIVKTHNGKPMFGMIGAEAHSLSVDLERVSHMVENIRMEGDVLTAEIRTISTPLGDVLATLLKADIPVAFRMAGRGRVEFDGDLKLVTDYAIRSIDAVGV